MDYDKLRYVILHSHPENLVISQKMRDQLFSTGTLIDIKECPLYSLQPEFIKGITRRPLVLILWGMKDRYGVFEHDTDVEVVEVDNYGDAMNYCEGLRPYPETWTNENGQEYHITYWKRPVPDELPV